MATSYVVLNGENGDNYYILRAGVRFFDFEIELNPDGSYKTSESVATGTNGMRRQTKSPQTVLPRPMLWREIECCFLEDIRNRVEDSIAILIVAPQVAGYLYMSERITARDLWDAKECEDYIDIPDRSTNVTYSGKTYTFNYVLRIQKDAMYAFATADKNGKIIE